MALKKDTLAIDFSQGLETKTDPKKIPFGKFLRLKNSVFTKGNLLLKRNGNKRLSSLPDDTSNYLTTFNGNLTAIGPTLEAYSSGSATWLNKGKVNPVKLDTIALIRSNSTQTQVDTSISVNGLVCTVYTETGTGTTLYKYSVTDVVTGQNIVTTGSLTPTSGAISGSPRVFLLGNYFVIVFTATISAVNHLQYQKINTTTPAAADAAVDITSAYTAAASVAFDGIIANDTLYLAWNGNDGGGAIRMCYINSSFIQSSTKIFAGESCSVIGVGAVVSGASPVIYVAYYKTAGNTLKYLSVNSILSTIQAPLAITNTYVLTNITLTGGTLYAEVNVSYSYGTPLPTHFVAVTALIGAFTAPLSPVMRSVGLASKAFRIGDTTFVLAVYQSEFQPTYFLISSTSVVARLASLNGGNYVTAGLPSVTVINNTAYVAYQFRDLLVPVNRTQGVSNSAGVYAQLGLNLAKFTISSFSTSSTDVTVDRSIAGGQVNLFSAEIANNLHISGGFLWMYDGVKPVEHGFHVYPDNLIATQLTTGGSMIPQTYYYIVTYEWSDNQGNIHRSAPSLPLQVIVPAGTNTNKVTLNIPYLRLTAKDDVKLVVYRWSTANQIYYQATTITSPIFNLVDNPTDDSTTFVDMQADATIAGNSILYTTGGVVENSPMPATDAITLYKQRVIGIDAENRNQIWFSKQVIQSVPVEFSNLFVKYIAPTIGSQGSTGDLRAAAPMDDKLILFKRDAIYYITGNGPDNTGSNDDFSEPVFITSTVGSENQRSIVMQPNGLMFQSDKGIWILKRDLTTQYIGAPVEAYNDDPVVAAIAVPGTNRMQFTLTSGATLMYDYYYDQWGVFEGMSAVSAALYQDMVTYIDSDGRVFQENPGSYLDGSRPVLMGFTTGWFNLMGLQGYQRAYWFNVIGTYLSPHKLNFQIAYDYESPSQAVLITPDNFALPYGDLTIYGGPPSFGGAKKLEQWEIFFKQQRCQAFQITFDEIYDASMGQAAGAGLTMSGLNLVVGGKSKYPPLKASNSAG